MTYRRRKPYRQQTYPVSPDIGDVLPHYSPSPDMTLDEDARNALTAIDELGMSDEFHWLEKACVPHVRHHASKSKTDRRRRSS